MGATTACRGFRGAPSRSPTSTTTAPVDLIVDLNAVSGVGITSFPNQRTDTRTGTTTAELPSIGPVPVWPPFTPAPALNGVAALTGRPAGAEVPNRPIV